MELIYKTIDELVVRIDERNMTNEDIPLVGLSIDKCFIPSVANTIGTDLSKYKLIRKRDFAVSLMQVSRDSKIPIACLKEHDIAIMSPAYSIFRVKDEKVILPEYLEMWFRRSEFDREAAFIAVGGVRGSMPWDEFAMMKVTVPDIEKQKTIIRAYKAINDRIDLKKKINENLVEQLQTYLSEFIKQDTKGNIVKLKDFSTMQYGYTETATLEDTGTKFLRITDIAQAQIDWNNVPFCKISDSDLQKYKLYNGDVVVARTGATVGVAKMIGNIIPNSVFASFLVRIRPIEDIYKYYFGLIITSKVFLEYVQNNAGGSAQPQANPPLLGEFELIIPEITSMVKFNHYVSAFLQSIEANERELSKLADISNTIITMISRL